NVDCTGLVMCSRVDSSGRGFGEYIRRGAIAQRLAWPRVEPKGDRIELPLGKFRQVRARGKVLPEGPGGISHSSRVPRTLRVAEVDLHTRRDRKRAMVREFVAAIPGQASPSILPAVVERAG